MPPSVEVCQRAYGQLLRTARRVTRSEDEALDLAQDAVLIALARGFADWASPTRQPWLHGVARKRAAFIVRSEARQRRREQLPDGAAETDKGAWVWRTDFLASLPPSLRVVATLAEGDLCAAEIRWLLLLSDTALRQRLTALRRAVLNADTPPTLPALAPQLSFSGPRVQVLAAVQRQRGRVLATHDPDGHTILLRIAPHRLGAGGNTGAKEFPCPNRI